MELVPSNNCNFCNVKETPEHRLLTCRRAGEIWRYLDKKTGCNIQTIKDLFEREYSYETRALKLELISIILNDNNSESHVVIERATRFISSLRNHSATFTSTYNDKIGTAV